MATQKNVETETPQKDAAVEVVVPHQQNGANPKKDVKTSVNETPNDEENQNVSLKDKIMGAAKNKKVMYVVASVGVVLTGIVVAKKRMDAASTDEDENLSS